MRLGNHELVVHHGLWMIDISHQLVVSKLILNWHVKEGVVLAKHDPLRLMEHILVMVVRVRLLDVHSILHLRFIGLQWTYFIHILGNYFIPHLWLLQWLL